MSRLATALALPALALQASDSARPVPPSDHPAALVLHATYAVEGDSVAAVRARWQARLASDPLDRAALLGLATLSRLTYDYPRADRFYHMLTAGDSTQPNRFGIGRRGRRWNRRQAVG
jgi:hypothetical protein